MQLSQEISYLAIGTETANGVMTVEDQNDNKWWYECGKLHRDGYPAIEYSNGTKYWYQNGQSHRDDGPAFESTDGEEVWHCRGKLHRDDGPAITYCNGGKSWYRHGELHHIGGPAIDWKMIKQYFINGIAYKPSQLHQYSQIIKRAFWRVRQRRLYTLVMEELSLLPPFGPFPGGAQYHAGYEHFYQI